MVKKGDVIITLILAFFLGLMVPILGGLVFPSMLTKVAGPFITSKNEKIELDKSDYSYKPGQSGTQFNYYIESEDGERNDVTIKLLAYSFFIYSVALIPIVFVSVLIYKKFPKKTVR